MNRFIVIASFVIGATTMSDKQFMVYMVAVVAYSLAIIADLLNKHLSEDK